MLTPDNMMLEIGAVMLIAFIGATIASKLKQSVILGYIIVGIILGPHIHFQLGPFTYNGIIRDTTIIDFLSYLGLILLMFFIGLEFSFSKVRKTKSSAAIIAMLNLGINMFTGIMLGTAMGWPIVDTIFLAGIISMSSSAVAMKSIIELKRLANPETEFLIGISVTESFLAMVLLTIIAGLMIKDGTEPVSLSSLALGIIVFYAFFVFLALWVIPKTVHHLRRIKNDEMFVLFALGIVFLAAAFAEISGVPAIIGAFFIGMVFAETKVSERFEEKIVPFRDAFVAVFFVSFGMLIDPLMFVEIWWLILAAATLVIINDFIITAALAYLLGFSSKASMSIGSALCGRDAESVMFASVGSRAFGATKGAILYPFAGALCFVTSAITPFLMRNSLKVAGRLSSMLPAYVKHGGAVISRTLSKLVMPSTLPVLQKSKGIGILIIAYFLILCATAVTTGYLHILIFIIGILLTIVFHFVFSSEISRIVRSTNYSNLNLSQRDNRVTVRIVSSFVSGGFIAMMLAAFLYPFYWPSTPLVLLMYVGWILLIMRRVYQTVSRRPIAIDHGIATDELSSFGCGIENKNVTKMPFRNK
ncbi:MAG: cation:proton antiporter [Methanomassiliicoccales archaeon]|jgi:CPA2 family monovalent cation:H+ antiporter-2|nr:cation:proton antiporter [Methanomassiliicoccales archaeon]